MNVQTLVIQVRLGPTLKFVLNTHTDTQATHTHACMHALMHAHAHVHQIHRAYYMDSWSY